MAIEAVCPGVKTLTKGGMKLKKKTIGKRLPVLHNYGFCLACRCVEVEKTGFFNHQILTILI